jgi:hypothetical protein
MNVADIRQMGSAAMLLLRVTVTVSGALRQLAQYEPPSSELDDLVRPKPDCGSDMKAWNFVRGAKPVNVLSSDSQNFCDLGDIHDVVALS